VSLELDRDDDDSMQETGTLVVPHLGLIPVSVAVVLHGGTLQVLHRDVGVVQFAAVLATWASAGIGACRGEIQRGIMTSLGHQLYANATHHGQGWVVANVAIEHPRTPWHGAIDRGQWLRHHELKPLSC
jgi:GAF domain-containing protein